MGKKISSKQLMFSAAAFILASGLLSKQVYHFTEHESWISILLGFLVVMVLVMIYGALAKRFPSLSYMEINEAVFGKVLGKLVSVLYLYHFLQLAVFNTRDITGFVKSSVLPETPTMITIIVFLIVCAAAVRKDAAVFTRIAAVVLFVSILAILFNTVLLTGQFKVRNFLPFISLPVKNYVMSAQIVAFLPLGEISVFLMFTPFLDKKVEVGKMLRRGLILGTAIILLLALRDIAVLGRYILISTMPSFAVLRLINTADILTRLEILYAVILISLLFFKVSVLYYATVSGTARLLRMGSYQPLVKIVGAFIAIYATYVFSSTVVATEWIISGAAVWFNTFFLAFLPLLTLIVAVVRKLGSYGSKQGKGADA